MEGSIEDFKKLLALIEENYVKLHYPSISVADAIDCAKKAKKNSDNDTLKITFEWQTRSLKGIESHKISV